MPGSLAENFGDASACPWSPGDGLCDAGAYELSGAGAPTCSELGGLPCAAGELCDGGAYLHSSDEGDLCCVGGTCTGPAFCDDGDGDDTGGEIGVDRQRNRLGAEPPPIVERQRPDRL